MLDRSMLALRRPIAWRRGVRGADAAPGPFLKWVGGKSRLLGELVSRAPRDYRRYHEPFLGGAALYFALRPASSQLSDRNADLIDCYRAVRNDVEGLIYGLGKHRARHDESYYYEVRTRWNEERGKLPLAERAAAFLYMNKTCYNGLWRVNRSGGFNVPVGRYENPTICDPTVLRAASRALRAAHLQHAGFERILDDAQSGDFVYFDPPYDPISATANFTSYTTDSFGPADQARLAAVCRELADRGCAVMLSNSDTPLIRKLYAGFRVDRVFAPRFINSKADSRGAVAEVLVTNEF